METLTPIISTQGLTKTYSGVERVSDVSLNIYKGEIYGLIGKNGAGKTTLLRLILSVAAPTRGSVAINGNGSASALAEGRRKIGALIEQPAYYRTLNGFRNLKAYALALGCYDAQKVKDLLLFVGLEPNDKKPVKNYSLGMRQRLSIAMALLNDPEVLILDEPLNGLDPTGIIQMREQIRFLNEKKGVTVIISSHLLGELGKVATAYGIMREGKMVKEVRGEELASLSRPHIRAVVADLPRATQLLAAKFAPEDYSIRPDGAIEIYRNTDDLVGATEIFVSAGIPVLQLSVGQNDTEEAFVALMQEERK